MYVYVYSLIFILTLWHSCWRTSTATLTGTCLHSCVGTCTQRKARVTCGTSLQASVRGEYFAENIEGENGFWAGIIRKMRAKYPPGLSLCTLTLVSGHVSRSLDRDLAAGACLDLTLGLVTRFHLLKTLCCIAIMRINWLKPRWKADSLS